MVFWKTIGRMVVLAWVLGACSERTQPVSPAVVVEVQPPVEAEGTQDLGEQDDAPAPWKQGDPVPDAWLRPELAVERAPERFRAVFDTTKGTFVVQVHRAWAPHGADRFYNLARIGYYTDVAFFRVIDGFMAQFGIHGVPEVNQAWREARIPDDPVVQSNVRGTLAFGMAGPGTRTVQLFVNTVDNARLDGFAFAPFGEVIAGMSVVDDLFHGYGEGAPGGRGPNQAEMQRLGNEYLQREFPRLDYVIAVRVQEGR